MAILAHLVIKENDWARAENLRMCWSQGWYCCRNMISALLQNFWSRYSGSMKVLWGRIGLSKFYPETKPMRFLVMNAAKLLLWKFVLNANGKGRAGYVKLV